MATATDTSLVDRQVAALNSGNIDGVVAAYADDATFVLYSAHTLPGSELRLEGKERITKHMQRVLDGGIEGVEVHYVGGGDGVLVWHDTGSFGPGIAFSEAHMALLDGDGMITSHTIHSVYGRG